MKIVLKILFIAITASFMFLVNKGVVDAQVCGSSLSIDVYNCYYDSGSNSCKKDWAGYRVLPCSLTGGGDCKTDVGVCANVSNCSGTDRYVSCSTTSNSFCDSSRQKAACAAGTAYTCKDGLNCSCTYQRYDCWIGGTPTPTPTGGTGTPTPVPSCAVNLLPSATTTSIGSAITLVASVTVGSGSVGQVNFTSSNPGIASVNPASDSTVTYSTQATGVANGTATVTSDVVMGGSVRCTDTSNVDVMPAGPWWQVKDADVTSGGDIVSLIPGTCSLPVCNPVFDIQGDGGYPGIPIYAGVTADFRAGAGTGTVSDAPYSWLVNSSYASSKSYDYSYFARQIPADVPFTEITTPTYNGGDFNSGGAPSRGYVWYHYDGATLGDMTIAGNVNLTGSRRVVLMVDGADLYITGLVNLNSPGNGFFMAVVGKDASGHKGNIIVDPSVSHPNQPAMEGVFLAEGEFRSGAGTDKFYFRGSLAAYDGVFLERDLGTDNADTPAELFEYSPAIMATFPQVFTQRRMRWKEVAP